MPVPLQGSRSPRSVVLEAETPKDAAALAKDSNVPVGRSAFMLFISFSQKLQKLMCHSAVNYCKILNE